jgi:hypothetical protein
MRHDIRSLRVCLRHQAFRFLDPEKHLLFDASARWRQVLLTFPGKVERGTTMTPHHLIIMSFLGVFTWLALLAPGEMRPFLASGWPTVFSEPQSNPRPDTPPSTWAKTYEFFKEGALSLAPTSDEWYVLVRSTACPANDEGSPWVLKLDTSGNILWQKAIEGVYGHGSSVSPTSDGGYVVATIIGSGSISRTLEACDEHSLAAVQQAIDLS